MSFNGIIIFVNCEDDLGWNLYIFFFFFFFKNLMVLYLLYSIKNSFNNFWLIEIGKLLSNSLTFSKTLFKLEVGSQVHSAIEYPSHLIK